MQTYSGIAVIIADKDYGKYKKTSENHLKNFAFTFKYIFEKNISKTILKEKLFTTMNLFLIHPSQKKTF